MFRRLFPILQAPHYYPPLLLTKWPRHFSSSPALFKRRPIRPIPNENNAICDTEAKRLDRARANHLYKRVERLLWLKKHNAAHGLFQTRISEPAFHNSTRLYLFEETIELFMRHKRMDDAANIHRRMVAEGFVGSAKLRTMMLVLGCAQSKMTETEMISGLQQIFVAAKEEFDDARLLWLLSYLSEQDYPPSFIENVLDRYVAVQEAGYRVPPDVVTHLISEYSDAGRMKDAKKWLLYHSAKVADKTIPSHPKDPFPYTTFIYGLNRKSKGLTPVYESVLQRMQKDGVWPDTALINVLIQSEVYHGRTNKAFQLYRALKSKSTRDMYPDEFTFSSLFRALEKDFHAQLKHRDARHPAPQTAPDVVTARMLFRDMLGWYDLVKQGAVTQSWPDIITASNLDLVLRLCVTSADYAAALVILRSFSLLRIRPEYRTTLVVVTALARRVQRDMRKAKDEAPWPHHFFFGIPREDRATVQMASLDMLQDSVTKIGVACLLAAHSQPSAIDNPGVANDQAKVKSDVREKIILDEKRGLHVDLLFAILQRALEASVASTHHLRVSFPPSAAALKLFHEEITIAQEEMVPPMSEPKWNSFEEFFRLAPNNT